jgi:hypothetical protein
MIQSLIVLALQFQTDGFDPANPNVPGILYKNIDTFTGQCTMTAPGVTALTQGNETLTPTWSVGSSRTVSVLLRRSRTIPFVSDQRVALRLAGTESLRTRRWSKPDSNSRSHPDGELG